ncbi:hypothetical protein [Pleionea sp. CnH1-48]|uniref:hypothetical protein n=1 Tax=Pleionea sp. CnH1-48 TaxID=2954494 RepID=UPI0020977CCC|nr:hypothetical protein [Pleionea sp. CnH1-48]MCO7225393.1 hypothetical protein [Pleionea sp. CnH1-48]
MKASFFGNTWFLRLLTFCKLPLLLLLFLNSILVSANHANQNMGEQADLPLPSSLPLVDYEKVLYRWTLKRQYTKLGWAVDKGVRDTGPYINQTYYGTHPAVRIYYSPEVMMWLQGGRRGDLPDGSMIIKEMFTPPAALYQELAKDPRYRDPKDYDKLLASLVSDWTIMVKDSQASADGWFWGSVSLPKNGQTIEQSIAQQVDTQANRNGSGSQLRYSGFAMPCVRCHSSAEKELTFSALENIKGFSGDPIIFFVDNSWRTKEHFSPNPLPDPYPLNKLKDDPFVQSIMMLSKPLLPWDTQQSLKSASKSATSKVINIDHSTRDNLVSKSKKAQSSSINAEFVKTFPEIQPVPKNNVKAFPPQWLDHVVMPAEHPTEFVTSDNCMGCHGGLGGSPYGVTMFVKTGPQYGDGFNVSEYGEWRWSPMGLAGRDPIFHAQLESEMAILVNNEKYHPHELKGSLKSTQQAVTNTCLSCHGAMGQRQLAKDAATNPHLDKNFKVDYYYLTEALTEKEKKQQQKQGTYEYNKYGALAREGISCMVCHHIDAPDPLAVKNWSPTEPDWINRTTPKELAYVLFHNSTGQFNQGPADKIFGPFDVIEKPMEHALGATPFNNPYIKDSQLCGTCHTINLPNIGLDENKFPVLTAAGADTPFKDYNHTIEQATFLEWQNSAFAEVDNNGKPGKDFQSCQDCHMPNKFQFESDTQSVNIDSLVTKIATIQDSDGTDAEHLLPLKEMTVPLRDTYKRHTHVGMNVFLLEMFNQFSDILGVEKSDYMTSATTGNELALNSMITQAQRDTVELDVNIQSLKNNLLTTRVTLTNKTGHRLPSGVAFRRVFIEFTVFDGESPIWSSGKTNSVGVILGADNKPLNTEFLPNKNSYQQHHQVITREDQVQIYEELNLNAQEEFTTSFIHRVDAIKDNRLLPKGWRQASYFKPQGQVIYQFMEATDPEGLALQDKDYQNKNDSLDFKGQDSLLYKVSLPQNVNSKKLSVKATVYSQSIPPYWLKQRFELAPDGLATQRLYYLTSHLDLSGTPMENWKLKLVSKTAALTP